MRPLPDEEPQDPRTEIDLRLDEIHEDEMSFRRARQQRAAEGGRTVTSRKSRLLRERNLDGAPGTTRWAAGDRSSTDGSTVREASVRPLARARSLQRVR